MKICKMCNQSLSLDMFHSHKGRADGKASYCKPCNIKKVKEYRESLPVEKDGRYGPRSEEVRNAVAEGVRAAMATPQVRKAISNAKKKPIKAVSDSGSVMRFPSGLDAENSGFNRKNVSRAITQSTVYRGYRWYYDID